MKFFLDANIPYSAQAVFKKNHCFAQHAKDAGLARASDTQILEHAIREKSILVTKDLEFGNRKTFPHIISFGVIIIRLPFYFKAVQLNNVVDEFLRSVEKESLNCAITILSLGRYRIRKP